MAKQRVKKLSVTTPQSREEVVAAIAEIGELARQRGRIEADMNDEIARLRTEFEEAARPAGERITALTEGVRIWCEAHRNDLTQNGKTKTVNMSSGDVKWRVTPPKVTIRGVEAVMDALKRLSLGRFIRTKEEINKDAILADQEAVRRVNGISISQVEEFVIEPFETQLEPAGAAA